MARSSPCRCSCTCSTSRRRRRLSESLLIVGSSALIGALDYGRAGRLRLRTGLVFALAGTLGSLPGTAVNRQIGSHALLLGFAAVLLAAGVAMLRRGPAAEPARDARTAPAAAAGVGTGFPTGLFGVGGGFIIVPALVTLLGFPLHAAVGTSLLVIALTSAAALAAHLATGPIAWTLSLAFAAAAVAGVLAGRRLSHRLPARTLTRGFAVLLLAVALLLSVENVAALW